MGAPTGEIKVQGYVALPGSGGGPAVIVLPETPSLHATTVADRLAQAGFVAMVSDDTASAARELAARPEVTGKVGVVGFGAGADHALAASDEQIAAVVAYYPATGSGTFTGAVATHAAGAQTGTYRYPDAQPGFFNDDRPEVYDLDAATVSWARTIEFLRSNLR